MANFPSSPASDEFRAGVGPTSHSPAKTIPERAEPFNDRAASPRDILVALTYGLELVRHGAMLVAEGGGMRLANQTALSILKKKDGISLARTGLVADRASDTRLLHKLLQEAISSPQSGEPKESPITLERRSAHGSLIVRGGSRARARVLARLRTKNSSAETV